MKKLRILILCGGKSAERQVSLVSAKQVLSKLDRSRCEPELVLIDAKGRWLKADEKRLSGKVESDSNNLAAGTKAVIPTEKLSSPSRPDVVFPVLHGPMGEDGTVQGLLELAGVAYVGCGVLGSALGMDKEVSKRLALQAGLPLLPYRVIRRPSQGLAALRELGLPVFVKPARLGSSVGVSKVKSEAELLAALESAFLYDDKVILEKGIEAREIECAALGDPWAEAEDPLALKASICGEIAPQAEFYDYKAKYLDPEGARLLIPAPLPQKTSDEIREMALAAFKVLDCYAMGRVDFLMDKHGGRVYFNEINTIPGFTPASMYPLLWQASGIETPKLLELLIELALRRGRARSKLKTTP
ncbi:MAG: D-alanine--D-alanine ligase [Elusimicrobia bacterium]|nr:D-alanine--D-alanine ligase [Elusimicrobiota bacterium]